MYVLFEYLSESVAHFCCPLKGILGMLTEMARLLQASRLDIFVMLVFVTMQSSCRAEHCFRTGFEEYIRNVAIPEHEHVAEADGSVPAGSAHMIAGRLSYEYP